MTTQELSAPADFSTVEASRSNLWKDALARLAANRLAVVGIIPIVLLFFIAIFGPYLTPVSPLAPVGAGGRPAAGGRDAVAPVLGEHTDEVLAGWLGLSAAEIGRLHDAGVIAGSDFG